MKRMLKRMTIALALVAILAVSAFAANFTHCADALKDLGLFQGSSTGYELDRAPTRAEAATMLVRLMGQETAAKELTYSAPFTDVPVWAQPYVQYLFENGLTSGKTATTFAPDEACSAQMYATFLMRALGYSDKEGGQFTYADAIKFATEKGVIDYANCDEKNFLRDHVVAMSYTALATDTATGDANLLASLLKSGVIKDAKGHDKLFQTYGAYEKAMTAAAAKQTTKAHMKADIAMSAKMAGMDFMSGTMTMDLLMDMNLTAMDSSKIAMTGKMDFKINPLLVPEDNTMVGDMNYYYADGVYYMNMLGEKSKMKLSVEDALAQMGDLSMQTTVEPISTLKSISVNGNTYTVSYLSSGFNALLDTVLGSMDMPVGVDAPAMKVDKLNSIVTFSNDTIIKQVMDMTFSMDMEGQKIEMTMNMTMTDVGGTVNVVLPTDLSTYKEIIGGADAPAA